jgi:HSP20 family protein
MTMADLTRWPTREGRHLAGGDVDGWLSSFFGNYEPLAQGQWPKTDIYEDKEGVTLRFEVPGIDANQIRVQVIENALTVSGERKLENEQNRQNYHRVESSYGTFERSFSMPQSLDTEKMTAQYRNGVLTVHVPRSERSRPRSVQVKVEQKQ